MKYALYIIAAFLICFAWIFFPGAYGFLLLAAAIGLVIWLIYAVVKAAVKSALREYDEEKARANGQK